MKMMQVMVDALMLAVVLAVFMLCVRCVPWLQRIWIKNGKWHTWRFMLMIVALLIIQDIITWAFGEAITAWLIAQGIGFGVLYAIYALLVMALGLTLIISAYKTSQTSPKWLGVLIHLSILAMMLSMPLTPFW